MTISFPNGKKLNIYYNQKTNELEVFFKNTNKYYGIATPKVKELVKKIRDLSIKPTNNYNSYLRDMTKLKNELLSLLYTKEGE